MINRHTVCIGLFLSAVTLITFCGNVSSATTDEPVKIGLLAPFTGPFAINGASLTKGIELYLAQNKGKVADRVVQVIKEDSEGNPGVGLTKARKLVEKDKVDVIIGPVNSAVAFAIQKYIDSSKTPVVSPASTAEGLTKPPNLSPYLFRLQVTAMQVNVPFGEWVVKNTPYRKMAIIAADFAPGRDGAEAFTKGFEGAGAKIVQAVYAKVGESDYAPYLARLVESKSDAVYAWTAGADSIRLVTQYAEFGLKGKLPLFGFTGLVEEFTLPGSKDAALGIVAVTNYSPGYKGPENVSFVNAYKKAYKNDMPSQLDATGFISVMLIDSALKAVKGNIKDKSAFIKAMAETKLDKTPRGPIRFDENRQVICNAFITRAEKVAGRVENVVIDQIPNVRQP